MSPRYTYAGIPTILHYLTAHWPGTFIEFQTTNSVGSLAEVQGDIQTAYCRGGKTIEWYAQVTNNAAYQQAFAYWARLATACGWQTTCDTHRGPAQHRRPAKGAKRKAMTAGEEQAMATVSLVLASVLGTVWAWIVWIVIGGIAGAIADQLVQGNKLGILGNIVVGIIGGLLGGFILGLFGVDVSGIFWTFITALVGAIILLWIVGLVTGGRGIGGRVSR